MLTKAVGSSLALLACIVGCHSVLIRVERRGSAALFNPGEPQPKRFFDGHAIPFPAAPFVNCFDTLASEMPAETCSPPRGATPKQTDALRNAWRAFYGYTRDQVIFEAPGDMPPSWLRRARFDEQQKQLDAVRGAYATLGTAGYISGSEYATVEALEADSLGYSIAKIKPYAATVDAFLTRFDLVPHDKEQTARSIVFLSVSDAEVDPKPQIGALVHDDQGTFLIAFEDEHQFSRDERVRIFDDLNLAEPLASFIHISDAQIREPNAKLGGQQVSDRLDPLVPSFAHDYEQELYSAFIYDAFIHTTDIEIYSAQCDQDELDSSTGHLTIDQDTCLRRAKRCGRSKDQSKYCDAGIARPTARTFDPHLRSYRPAPSFMIHTGDSIDAGLESEFNEFLTRSDDLIIPWYSVIGNHDVLGFGNLDMRLTSGDKYQCTPTRRLLREYHITRPRQNGDEVEFEAEETPASKPFALVPFLINRICLSTDVGADRMLSMPRTAAGSPSIEFIQAHCRGRSLGGGACRAHELEAPPEYGNDLPNAYAPVWTYDETNGAFAVQSTVSRQNGLDMTRTSGGPVGWYAFEVQQLASTKRRWQGKLWAVVLDTTSMEGAFGAFSDRQQKWLADLLPSPNDDHPIKKQDLVIVFAHHPLWGISDPGQRHALKKLLLDAGNVIAYFAGHTHSPQLRAVGCTHRTNADTVQSQCSGPDYARRRFWEVIAPATLAFPQQARQVTIKTIPNSDLGYLEVLSFEPHLSGDQQTFVAAAMKGAERDECDQYPSSCVNGRPRLPESRLMYPRLFFRMPSAALPSP